MAYCSTWGTRKTNKRTFCKVTSGSQQRGKKKKKKVYLSDPRLRTDGDNALDPDAVLRGGGWFSEKSALSPALVGSRTSPWDATRVGVRGGKLCVVCEGDAGGMPGDGGAMRPSALRDDARRSPGTKPNIRRRSEERAGRGRCADVGKEAAEGELTASREPDVGSVLSFALRLRKRNNGVSQTQSPKKVAMSPKVGALTTGPPRYALCAA